MSYIYFVQGPPDGPIKIGTAVNVERRLASLQCGNHHKLTVLASVPGTLRDELALHRSLCPHRVFGEWFAPLPAVMAVVEEAREGRLLIGEAFVRFDRGRDPAFEKAVALAGSQMALAAICNCRQGSISSRFLAGKSVIAEWALPIHRALGIPLEELRPDLYFEYEPPLFGTQLPQTGSQLPVAA